MKIDFDSLIRVAGIFLILSGVITHDTGSIAQGNIAFMWLWVRGIERKVYENNENEKA